MILALDENLKDCVSFNSFTLELLINRAPPITDDVFTPAPGPYPRQITDNDKIRLLSYIQKFYIIKCTMTMLDGCLNERGETLGKHPVRDWLSGLVWDETARLDSWLSQVYGVPLDSYHKAVGAKVLIAAVRRVRRPGCKFDQMMVLEGGQGIGKSRSLVALFGLEWFADQIAGITSKDAGMDLHGKWCIEFAEIDHIIRADVETVKGFLSRSTDHFRAPYGRTSKDYPRQCIFIGTTNTDDYLRDHTGNRRFWPVRCRSVGTVDMKWLTENREQIWAEAAYREAEDETIWLDTDITRSAAEDHQADRLQVDPWHLKIDGFVSFRSRVDIPEILSECLMIPYAQQTKTLSNRVGAVLRVIGWGCVTRRNSDLNKTERFWQKITQADVDV